MQKPYIGTVAAPQRRASWSQPRRPDMREDDARLSRHQIASVFEVLAKSPDVEDERQNTASVFSPNSDPQNL